MRGIAGRNACFSHFDAVHKYDTGAFWFTTAFTARRHVICPSWYFPSPTRTDWRRCLGSASTADIQTLSYQPHVRRRTVGDCEFAVAGPRAWNSLPPGVRLTFVQRSRSRAPNALYKPSLLHYITDGRSRERKRETYATMHCSRSQLLPVVKVDERHSFISVN